MTSRTMDNHTMAKEGHWLEMEAVRQWEGNLGTGIVC